MLMKLLENPCWSGTRQLGDKFGPENIGLYCDDGLACFHGISGPDSDRIRKDIVRLFQDLGLSITTKTNIKVVDFLDVTLSLLDGTCKPYIKPTDRPLYINTRSNHPPCILKSLPENISRRISKISSSEEIFKKAAPIYNEALSSSGYKEKLVYIPDIPPPPSTKRRGRKGRSEREVVRTKKRRLMTMTRRMKMSQMIE